MLIGLLCHRAEEDILPETLALNAAWCDAVYEADPEQRTDGGARGPILEQAYAEHGTDHWFVLLHADELWVSDPRAALGAHPEADGIAVRLRLAFSPDPWDDDRSVLEQCHRSLVPGFPEFRLFRGGPGVHYEPSQHFFVRPHGLGSVVVTDDSALVNHYPYRSPASQIRRAAETWDPDNYRGAPLDGDAIRQRLLGGDHYREEVAT